jgi:hypothetical protein
MDGLLYMNTITLFTLLSHQQLLNVVRVYDFRGIQATVVGLHTTTFTHLFFKAVTLRIPRNLDNDNPLKTWCNLVHVSTNSDFNVIVVENGFVIDIAFIEQKLLFRNFNLLSHGPIQPSKRRI